MGKETTRRLECLLTSEDIASFALESAKNISDNSKILVQKKESMNGFKSELDEIARRHRYLSDCVINEVETREVDCKIVYDWKSGKKAIIRIDTGEVVQEMPVTDEERQENIDFGDSK